MRKFGLVGKDISYSFSPGYFAEKFKKENLEASYENFDLQEISEFPEVIQSNPGLEGLNVTIPYKEAVIPYLDRLDPVAKEIGAVNTIKIEKDGSLTGFNTDHYGFTEALRPYLQEKHKKALILGTGGASKAVLYGLNSLGITSQFVSRTATSKTLAYDQLDAALLAEHLLIVNCTPLGTSPKTTEYPNIPIEHLNKDHLVFDLIYNPPVSRLLELSKRQQATILNGQTMLEFQAEEAWKIWNRK